MKPQTPSLPSAQTQGPKRNYPLNCWWVAATAEEVTRKPIGRWLLDQRVVLFRTEEGAVVALEDRCAHRWAPLSQGKLIGDEIACPYHGFRYNTRGACTLVPTQSHVPAALKVRSYPVREHGTFLWIWMGDPERASPEILPDIPWFTDPAYVQLRGYSEVACNYMAIQENVLDLSHLAYLHADKLQADPDQQEGWQELPVDVQVTDRTVTMVLKHSDVPVAPIQAKAMGIAGKKRINRSVWATFWSPACNISGSDIEDPAPTPGERERYKLRSMHCTTPISPDRCHYWFPSVHDYGYQLPNFVEEFNAVVEGVVKQDKDMLEAIQMTMQWDMRGDTVPEVSVRADRAGIEVRRIVKKLVDAEL